MPGHEFCRRLSSPGRRKSPRCPEGSPAWSRESAKRWGTHVGNGAEISVCKLLLLHGSTLLPTLLLLLLLLLQLLLPYFNCHGLCQQDLKSQAPQVQDRQGQKRFKVSVREKASQCKGVFEFLCYAASHTRTVKGRRHGGFYRSAASFKARMLSKKLD